MNKIGFKIDNCEQFRNVAGELIYVSEYSPLEFGLECYSKEEGRGVKKTETMETIFSHFNTRKADNIIHLSLEAKVLNKHEHSEKEWLNIWKKQAELIEGINIDYFIVHATSKESKEIPEQEQVNIIHENFKKLIDIFEKPIFIENTYEDLDFYKKLMDNADSNMHFTFDIGHKKIHSNESNESWLIFLKQLKEARKRIHFHIHDNNGNYDSHRPIFFYKNNDVLLFIEKLKKEFTSSNFILEQHNINLPDLFKEYIIVNGI